MREMRRAYALSGVAFVIMAVVVIVINFMLVSNLMMEKASADVSGIDRVYYETVDVQRSLFETRAANVFADALQDAAADALSVGAKGYTVARPAEAVGISSGDPESYAWFPSTPSISSLRLPYDANALGHPVTSIELYIKPAASGWVKIWFEDDSNNVIGPDPAGSARVSGGVGQKVKVWVDDPDSIDWSKVKKIRVQTFTDQDVQSTFSIAKTDNDYVYTVYYKAGEEAGHPACVVGGVNKYGLTTGAPYYTTGSYGQTCLKFQGCEKEGLTPPSFSAVTGISLTGSTPACGDAASQQNCGFLASSSCGSGFYPVCTEYTPVNCPEGSYYAGFQDENGNPVCSYTKGYQTEGCGIADYQYASCQITPDPESPDNQPIGKQVLKDACNKMKWEIKSRLADHFSRFSEEVTAVIPEQVTVEYTADQVDVQELESDNTYCAFKVNAIIPFTIKTGTLSKTKTVQVQRIVNISLLPPVKGNVLYKEYAGYNEGNATCAVCHTDCNGFFYDSEGNPVLAENDPAFCCSARSAADVQKSKELCNQNPPQGVDCDEQGGTGNCLKTYKVIRHYYNEYREMREYAKISVYDPDDPVARVDFGDRAGDLFHIDTYVDVDTALAGVDESSKPKECSDAAQGGPADTFSNPVTETYLVNGNECYDLSSRDKAVNEHTETLSLAGKGTVHSEDETYKADEMRIGSLESNGKQGYVRFYTKFQLPDVSTAAQEVGVPQEDLGIKSAKLKLTVQNTQNVIQGQRIAVHRTDAGWNTYTDLGWEKPPFAELAGTIPYQGQGPGQTIEVDVTPVLRQEFEEQKQSGDSQVGLGVKFETEHAGELLSFSDAELEVTYAPVFPHPICASKAPGQHGTVQEKRFDYWETLQSDASDSCRTDKMIVGTSSTGSWKNRGLIKFDVTGMPYSDVTRAELVIKPREVVKSAGTPELYVGAYQESMSSIVDSNPTHEGQTYTSCQYSWNTQKESTLSFMDDELAQEETEMAFDVTSVYLSRADPSALYHNLWILLKAEQEDSYPGHVTVCQDTSGVQDCNDRVFLRIYQGDKVSYYNVVDDYQEQPVCQDKKCYDTMKGGIGVYANNLTEPSYTKTISLESAGAAYETVTDEPGTEGYITTALKVGKSSKNRAVIQFNVSKLNIPPGATLKSAYLALKPRVVSPDGTFSVQAYKFKSTPNDISSSKYAWDDVKDPTEWQEMGSADLTNWDIGDRVLFDVTPEVESAISSDNHLALVMLRDAEEDDTSQNDLMVICDDDTPDECDYTNYYTDWGDIVYSYYFKGEQKPDLTVKIKEVKRHGDKMTVNSNTPAYFGEPLDVTLEITNQGTAEVPTGSTISARVELSGNTNTNALFLDSPLNIGESKLMRMTITPNIQAPPSEMQGVLQSTVSLGSGLEELDHTNNLAIKSVALRYRQLTFSATGYYNAIKRTNLDTATDVYSCDPTGEHKLQYSEKGGYSFSTRSFIQFNNSDFKQLLSNAGAEKIKLVYSQLSLQSKGFVTDVSGGDGITHVNVLSATKLRDIPLAHDNVLCTEVSAISEQVYLCTKSPAEGDVCTSWWSLFPELAADFNLDESYVGEQTVNITSIIQEAETYKMTPEEAALVLALFLPVNPQEVDSAKFYSQAAGETYAPKITVYGYCPSGVCPTGLEEFA